MELLCENKFCIYFKDGEYVMNSISLDEMGFCSQVYQVDIEEDYLDFKRNKLLKKFEQLDNC